MPSLYAGTYNFPEVTSYMGILALIAACSLFLQRWRSRPESRHWWVWYVVLVVGVLSALGNQTPFSHLMYAVPGIENERLLNRNILLVDFSLAVLLGWWLHVLVTDRADRAPVTTTLRSRWRQSPVRGGHHLHPGGGDGGGLRPLVGGRAAARAHAR